VETSRPARPRPQLAVHVADVRAGDDDHVHPERAEFLDCTPQIGHIGGAIGNRGAVPVEHDRLEAVVERRESAQQLADRGR